MGVYLRFEVAGEAYAMPIAHVIEVAALGQLVAIPGAPAEVLGVCDLRGQILPVVDLAAVLKLERDTYPSRLLVTAVGAMQAGFAVDTVAGVTELPEPAEQSHSPVLLGAVLADGNLIGVIDVARATEGAATSADSMQAGLP